MGDQEQHIIRLNAIKELFNFGLVSQEDWSKFVNEALDDMGYLLQSGTTQASQVSTTTPVLSQSHGSNGVPAVTQPVIRRFEYVGFNKAWVEIKDCSPVVWRNESISTWGINPRIDTFSSTCDYYLNNGYKEVSMAGHDPNDLQCCDPNTGVRLLSLDGKYHNVECQSLLSSTTPAVTSCVHTWKSYTGLRETFEFCTRCDEKRS